MLALLEISETNEKCEEHSRSVEMFDFFVCLFFCFVFCCCFFCFLFFVVFFSSVKDTVLSQRPKDVRTIEVRLCML